MERNASQPQYALSILLIRESAATLQLSASSSPSPVLILTPFEAFSAIPTNNEPEA